jgi:type I restriction enzyme R subunit
MPTAHLESTFEAAIVAHLTAHGWHEGDASSYRRNLGLDTAELFTFLGATQREKWDKLLALHGDADRAQQRFAKRLADELTSRGTSDVLRRGVTDLGVHVDLLYPEPAHELTPEFRELYDANCCTVTRQLLHSESNPGDAVDLTLFVNGIPVATAELKAETAGQGVAKAIAQYRHDRNPADLIFSRTVVHFAVDTTTVEMTTQLAGDGTVFRPFNQGTGGPGEEGGKGNPPNPGGHATAYLWEQVWERRTWLDLLATFAHVEKRTVTDPVTGKTATRRTLVFPRFHQWHAVRRLLDTARAEGPGTAKLIQHSAGSGKSNTIAWLAHGLSRLHTPHVGAREDLGPDVPVFDKTVVVTDRVVLDRQLQDTVTGFSHIPGSIVTIGDGKTSADLRAALESKQARIIITTLQKFSVVSQAATDLAGTRFAAVVDEAHSSQSGEAAKDLKAVLGTAEPGDDGEGGPDAEELLAASVAARGRPPNLTFFAFTATPKAKTLELFGDKVTDPGGSEELRPFHLYSMRQAIEEGHILDVLRGYTTYSTYYRLANGLGGEDPELPKGKAASALARFVSLHETNLAQKAEIIVEHFRAHTRPRIGGRAKAMVVTRSRLHAVKYHKAITEHITSKGYDAGPAPLRVLVAFSGTVKDPDAPTVEYREAMLNGFGEKQLPERFASDEYHVLVVAEKYQTGFDQPLLHTMYVDKKLAGVKAVQTLSRLNRTHPGKEDTFVLDFANTAEEIQEAFRPYFTQTTATPTDPNVLYNLKTRIDAAEVLHPDEVAAGVEAILAGAKDGSAKLNAALDPAVERYGALDEEEQDELRDALGAFVRAYAFLGQVVPFRDPELERLHCYGKYLLTKLTTPDTGGAVDLSGAVVLTHLRTALVAEQQDLSLAPDPAEPLPGLPGEGRGAQHEEPKSLLSELIEALNQRFGLDLSEADRIWFEQQQAELGSDDDVRAVALHNDADQFAVYLKPRIEQAIVDRHQANGELFEAYFGSDERRELVDDFLIRSLYATIRGERAS